MRPYHTIPIHECGEPLVAIPLELFAVESPHPYEKLSAPYGEHSPYFLRQTVVEKLVTAQNCLQMFRPDWTIQVFDAYRPVAVQKFMVNHAFAEAVRERGWENMELSEVQLEAIWSAVYDIWAEPSLDMRTPPPHSTGAAVDVTLVDEMGRIIDMGSVIDEMSERSLPDYYLNHSHPQAEIFHQHRTLLRDIMEKSGFQRNPKEWWHFSYGDQMWAWLNSQRNSQDSFIAQYGRL
ncbi:M15 family metallopeptidase [Calothrix sp. 336/3]|uniref:M15 family metallopeptidase n=1 Tax=Calothrix sp. 336/3 TaxID=1337936 RepID=UPI0004E2BA2C|nr:M15 family metallopeptidase [Calothrix sp. 336/3]AKG22670.1 D-alanyl-D-alanine dipeptidase [Calothrix sp. 336/3]